MSPQADAPDLAAPGLTILAEAHWPPPDNPAAPLPEAGRFTGSSFPHLVAAVADRCLSARRNGRDTASVSADERTAVLLVTRRADTVTLRTVEEAGRAGVPVVTPLLLQIAPTAVLGHIAATWSLGGPLLSITPIGEPETDGLALAQQILAQGDAGEVLLIVADQAFEPATHDVAHALLLTRPPALAAQEAGAVGNHVELSKGNTHDEDCLA